MTEISRSLGDAQMFAPPYKYMANEAQPNDLRVLAMIPPGPG